MNLETRQWDQQCLDVFGIRRECLPRIASNAEEYGRISSGPLQGTPICGCLGDQQAALLGARSPNQARCMHAALVAHQRASVCDVKHNVFCASEGSVGVAAPKSCVVVQNWVTPGISTRRSAAADATLAHGARQHGAHTSACVHAGQRCTQGHGKNTYGTGCFLLVHTGTAAVPSNAGLLSTIAYQLGPSEPAEYALEGSIAIAGMALSWLRDQMGLVATVEECEEIAAQVPDSGAPVRQSDCTACSQGVHQHQANASITPGSVNGQGAMSHLGEHNAT